ncbi:MAG: hypothetical protein DMG00_20905 [Acidobacteria bacterium]|nr:MAG: hypothetical protein DMG00_20905 [Acidobacteriota bacterium]
MTRAIARGIRYRPIRVRRRHENDGFVPDRGVRRRPGVRRGRAQSWKGLLVGPRARHRRHHDIGARRDRLPRRRFQHRQRAAAVVSGLRRAEERSDLRDERVRRVERQEPSDALERRRGRRAGRRHDDRRHANQRRDWSGHTSRVPHDSVLIAEEDDMAVRARVRPIIAVALLALVCASSAFAQRTTTGTVIGKIADSSGAVLPGVAVTLSSPEALGQFTGVTDSQGAYRVTNLPPATYDVAFRR